MTCNTCGHEQIDGFCHNKPCSRHGRRNDYLANERPAPLIEATEDHPAIYREGSRLRFRRLEHSYAQKEEGAR